MQEAAMRAMSIIHDEQLIGVFEDGLDNKSDIVKAYAAYGIAKLCQGRDDVAVSLTVKLIGMAQQ